MKTENIRTGFMNRLAKMADKGSTNYCFFPVLGNEVKMPECLRMQCADESPKGQRKK